MTPFQQINAALPQIAPAIALRGYFLKIDEIRKIAETPALRLVPIMVICGNGRFSCPAQNVEHFINIIDREKTDYVRQICVTDR
jgi:hypothetical protein